jgi:hypothetical protein
MGGSDAKDDKKFCFPLETTSEVQDMASTLLLNKRETDLKQCQDRGGFSNHFLDTLCCLALCPVLFPVTSF